MAERFSIRYCRALIKYAHCVLIGFNILRGFNPICFWDFGSDIKPNELLFVHVTQVARILQTVAMCTMILL